MNLRRANRKMPKRRLDIPHDRISVHNIDFLKKFATESGKIYPRRFTGVSAKVHRKVTREIKRARALNLM